MSNTILTATQLENIERSAYTELENLVPSLTELIEVRRKYAQELLRRETSDDKYFLSISGIKHCNEQIMKLLSISHLP